MTDPGSNESRLREAKKQTEIVRERLEGRHADDLEDVETTLNRIANELTLESVADDEAIST